MIGKPIKRELRCFICCRCGKEFRALEGDTRLKACEGCGYNVFSVVEQKTEVVTK
jgi:DNA-directed RNA polymerase subunit RPC12/RpoP